MKRIYMLIFLIMAPALAKELLVSISTTSPFVFLSYFGLLTVNDKSHDIMLERSQSSDDPMVTTTFGDDDSFVGGQVTWSLELSEPWMNQTLLFWKEDVWTEVREEESCAKRADSAEFVVPLSKVSVDLSMSFTRD